MKDTLIKNNIQKEVHNAITIYLKNYGKTPPTDLYQQMMQQVETTMIFSVLEHTGGNMTNAAKILGISRTTLRKKLTS